MRALIFIILIIPIIPLHILGLIIFTWRIRRVIIPQNISGTAAEPYGARLLMHIAGTRIDNTAYKIAEHMILYTPPVNFLMLQTTWLALKISGYKGYIFGYPGQRPSTLMTMMSHRSDFFDRSIYALVTSLDDIFLSLIPETNSDKLRLIISDIIQLLSGQQKNLYFCQENFLKFRL